MSTLQKKNVKKKRLKNGMKISPEHDALLGFLIGDIFFLTSYHWVSHTR